MKLCNIIGHWYKNHLTTIPVIHKMHDGKVYEFEYDFNVRYCKFCMKKQIRILRPMLSSIKEGPWRDINEIPKIFYTDKYMEEQIK